MIFELTGGYEENPLIPTTKILRDFSNKSISSGTSQSDRHKICLSYIQSNLFATIMEDIVSRIRLLDACSNELRIFKTQCELVELRSSKFGVQPSKYKNELDGIDVHNLHKEQYKLNKLYADREYCLRTITKAYLGLAVNCSIKPLTDVIQEIVDREDYYFSLIEQEAENKLKSREALKKVRKQRVSARAAIYEFNGLVEKLICQIEDAIQMKNTRERYIVNWQNSRIEQNDFQIKITETKPAEAIMFYRKKAEDEQRVHTELDLIENIMINESLSKVETLMAKFDADMEAIDLKIQITKNNYESQIEDNEELLKKFKDHDKEIQTWLQFKKDREAARLLNLKLNAAATAVQAWWRGLLVRLQLGPFKTKKSKAKGKKK